LLLLLLLLLLSLLLLFLFYQCCECTCEPDMFNCGGNYNCIDPDAACVEDDDGDGGVLTTADLGEEEDPPASCFDGQ